MSLASSANAAAESYVNTLGLTTDQKADALPKWQSLFQQLATWIATNGQITVTSVTGVTPGGGTSGPGTGTIS